MDDLTKALLREAPAAQLMRTFAALTHRMHEAEHDVDLRTQRDLVEAEILARVDCATVDPGPDLLALIDAYADAHARRYWHDDQGNGDTVAQARVEDEVARAAVLAALGRLDGGPL